jgi:hypothetical protein
MLLKAATVLRTARPTHHPTWVTSGDRVAARHRGVGAQWWNVRIRHDRITPPTPPGSSITDDARPTRRQHPSSASARRPDALARSGDRHQALRRRIGRPAAGSREGRPTGSGEGLGRCPWLTAAGSRRIVPDPDPVLAVRRLRRAGRDLRDHERNWSQQEMTSQGVGYPGRTVAHRVLGHGHRRPTAVRTDRALATGTDRLPQLHPARRRLTAEGPEASSR